jgi:hypothetical protein
VRHIVAVAEVGEFYAFELAECFRDGHYVGERLAGVEVVSKSVDYGKTAVLGEFLDVGLLERAYHHAVYAVAREHERGIVYCLAASELDIGRREEKRFAAELCYARFKRNARTRRRFGEYHSERLVFEQLMLFALVLCRFERFRKMKYLVYIGG